MRYTQPACLAILGANITYITRSPVQNPESSPESSPGFITSLAKTAGFFYAWYTVLVFPWLLEVEHRLYPHAMLLNMTKYVIIR